MKSLIEDMKTKSYKSVYLLYGEETYLRKQYKDKLKAAMVADDDTMNYAYFEGKGIYPGQIIDLAETMPFFAERRVMILENTGFLKNASPELADYVKTMPETTYLIFVEEEVDKRGKLFKSIKDCGRAVEFAKQDENTLLRWILSNVKRENKQIAENTVRFLLSKVGTDMETLQKEMEKLFSYTLYKEDITMEDVEAICTTQISNHIFDMVNAVAEKKQKRALEYYYDLLTLKEPPMRILFLMSRQFRILLQVKELERAGYGKSDIASKAGVPPFTVGKYLSQAKVFKRKELRAILEAALEHEEAVKTGRLGDVLSVELFIVKYSRA